jgi:hypothetical protein
MNTPTNNGRRHHQGNIVAGQRIVDGGQGQWDGVGMKQELMVMRNFGPSALAIT